jgi:hypothetical protein
VVRTLPQRHWRSYGTDPAAHTRRGHHRTVQRLPVAVPAHPGVDEVITPTKYEGSKLRRGSASTSLVIAVSPASL